MVRGLIVGVDSGTTSAVAVLDLRGNLLGKVSKKSFSQSEQQSYIQQFGQPIFFAVDVVKPSSTIEKLAASFNVRIEAPQKNLGRREKSALTSSFLNKYKAGADNFHEVSAVAAAIVFYNKHENKFRQIERQLADLGVSERIDEVKRKVIEGVSVNRVLEGRP